MKKKVEREGAYDMCQAIEGIYEDGKREGKREGRCEGQREERKNMLLLILRKLGEVSRELEKKIRQERNLGILEMWSNQALDAKSMEEFLQSM